MIIFCVECQKEVSAHLTDGREIYPHRSDLYDLPFWKCTSCSNFVGCHHKTKDRTRPLGCIPNKEIKNARIHIHAILDPLWKSGKFKRRELYKLISDKLGWSYHTAKLRSLEEARIVFKIIRELAL